MFVPTMMIRNTSRNWARFVALLALLALGCGDSTSTGYTTPRNYRVSASEGTIYTFLSTLSEPGQFTQFDTSRAELVSKIATVGGREGLCAFEWRPNTFTAFWDIDALGDMWQFHSITDVMDPNSAGAWHKVPTSRSGVSHTVLYDTTLTNGDIRTARYLHTATSSPIGVENIIVQGRSYPSVQVQTDYLSTHWRNGEVVSRSTSSILEWYVVELGIAVKSLSIQDDRTFAKEIIRIDWP